MRIAQGFSSRFTTSGVNSSMELEVLEQWNSKNLYFDYISINIIDHQSDSLTHNVTVHFDIYMKFDLQAAAVTAKNNQLQ